MMQVMEYVAGLSKQQIISIMFRLIALLAGAYQLIVGDVIIAVCIFASVGAISLPSLFTRGRIRSLPIEFELIFITIVMIQFVVGETFDFYDTVPFFDRFVHFSIPLFIGFIAFMVAYTLHETGYLNISTVPLMLVIIFMTLGIGAVWEIIEYSSDTVLSERFSWVQHLQGSVVETAHVDTMRDLMIDLMGGVIGALLGLRYIHTQSGDVGVRLQRIVKEIALNFK